MIFYSIKIKDTCQYLNSCIGHFVGLNIDTILYETKEDAMVTVEAIQDFLPDYELEVVPMFMQEVGF